MRTWERYLPEIVAAATLLVATAISLVLFSRYGTYTTAFSVVWGIATVSSVSLFFAVRRSGEDWHRKLRILFLIGLVLGFVSIFTGIGGNGTDEPYAIWGYLSELLHGQDPYTTLLTIHYTAHVLWFWSAPVTSSTYYTYLPLLLFFQVPAGGDLPTQAIGYELLALACWAGMVYVVRKDPFASLALASPVVALIAANGFDDLLVLFFMTLSLRGWTTGTKSKVVEYLTYGMKQFANVFWFVYYLLKRRWVSAGLVIVVTLAFALPFLLWNPLGIGCQALVFSTLPQCASQPSSARQVSDLYSHWNYYLWILWAYVLFHDWIHTHWNRWIAGRHRSIRVPSSVPTEPER
jgi:hypothetical protein